MSPDLNSLILVTGATGLVGRHVVKQAMEQSIPVRALVRRESDDHILTQAGVQQVVGSLEQPERLAQAVDGVTHIVHCAAKVGDWGPNDEYRAVNVTGTERLIEVAIRTGLLRKWIQISSLGVYSGTDHYGTDETTPADPTGIDGYTLSKYESEKLVLDAARNQNLPAVILRPGFIYGAGDRTVLPRLMERLQAGRFAYLGANDRLLNNTYVGNLVNAIWLALNNDQVIGQVFNIRDPRPVTRKEFIETICEAAELRKPTKTVPLPIARFLAWHMEGLARLFRSRSAPLLNSARIKFLSRNLDFDISKAERDLGYQPTVDFRDAMPNTIRQQLQESTVSAG